MKQRVPALIFTQYTMHIAQTQKYKYKCGLYKDTENTNLQMYNLKVLSYSMLYNIDIFKKGNYKMHCMY